MNVARAEAQADIRFYLPLRKGQRVLMMGAEPSLVEAVKREDLDIIEIAGSTQISGVEAASVNHAIVVNTSVCMENKSWNELARVIRPGGYIFAGIHNAESFQSLIGRFFLRQRKRGGTTTLRQVCKDLTSSGFEMENYYGLRSNLRQPAYIVPLMDVGPSKYFFENIFAPYSLSAIWMRRVALVMITMGLQRMFFNDLGLIARRLVSVHVA